MRIRKCAGTYISVNENNRHIELFYYDPYKNDDHLYDENDNPYKIIGNWPNAKAKKVQISF